MRTGAAYDAYADWYAGYVEGPAATFAARVARLVANLLGRAHGDTCLDVGCGNGIHAPVLRDLGWRPVGVDLSLGQLRYAVPRLPVAAGDAVALPVADACVPAVTCLLAHTDVPDYPAVVREAARVLRPGGRFVHVGVHPCFVGAFADRTDRTRIVVDSGYHRTERRFEAFDPNGVRARVGAWHVGLPALLRTALGAGLTLSTVDEEGPDGGVPDIFGFAAHKPA